MKAYFGSKPKKLRFQNKKMKSSEALGTAALVSNIYKGLFAKFTAKGYPSILAIGLDLDGQDVVGLVRSADGEVNGGGALAGHKKLAGDVS